MIKKTGIITTLALLALLVSCSEPANKGAGVIKNIYMPDSLQRPDSIAVALIRAEVEDPDGLDDVESVYFYSLKPNGEYANGGNGFDMMDDGTFGDEIAGDGIYSLGIQINDQAQLGTYIFTFNMRDKAGNSAEEVADSIKVYE